MRTFHPMFRKGLALVGLVPLTRASAQTPATQESALQVQRFTVEDGLAQNQVQAVAQDRRGFMWVGTRRGLQRFDGYSFVNYSTLDPAAPNALASLIYDLFVDARGRLWISTSQGFFRTDSAFRKAVRVSDVAAPWTLDAEGRLWSSSGGTLRWISTADDSANVVSVQSDTRWQGVSAIALSYNSVWLATPNESAVVVTRLDLGTGETRIYRAADARSPYALFAEGGGRVWIIANDGLELLEPGATEFRSLELFRGKRPTNMAPDGRGGFFVATDAWLARIDTAGQIIERWESPEVFGIGVYPLKITVDRDGGVWLASLTSGLVRLDLTRPRFDYRSSRSRPALPLANDFITAILERPDGTLWVGTFRGGAYSISPDWSETRAYRHDPRNASSLAADEVWDIEEDIDGNVWVATGSALCKFISRGFRCHRTPSKGADGATEIEKDPGGWFWITDEGLNVRSFDPRRGHFGPRVPRLSQISAATAVALFRDSKFLWIGADGLFRARVENGVVIGELEILRSATPGTQLYDFHRDHRDVLWIASDEGLHRWSQDSGGRLITVDRPELRGTTVFSIGEDRGGRLWLGTAHGLVQYVPQHGTARRYGRRDGFLSGELNRRAALRRRDGAMLFGGIEGLTQFDPDSVAGSHSSAPVVLTRWRKVTSDGPSEARIDGLQALRVEAGERAFTVEFAAMSFAPAVARRYRYRLDPLNSDWIESNDHVATYSTPKSGRYVFRVQTTSGPEGEWSSSGSAVTIDVIPPFYRTTWFKTLLAVAFVALLLGAHRLRLRQALATERLRLRISRDLHDEIGAGLSSIALISDAAGSENGSSGTVRAELQRIGESARTMVADLRDIVWAIDPEADRLNDVIARMKDVTADLLRDVRVDFHAPPAEVLSDRIGMAARRDLLLLYKEILHNIAKHARASEVHVDLRAQRNTLELLIADNGVGFSPNGSRPGTGLKSVRERAVRLGGQFDLHSTPGGGTTARLTLRRT